MSNSLAPVDFAVGLVNSVLNMPNEQVNFFGKFTLQKMKPVINPAHPKFYFGLIKLTLGLEHVSCSLPEWQAVKLTFFAPCLFLVLL